jgi:tRNA(Ile)-lysidine synthase
MSAVRDVVIARFRDRLAAVPADGPVVVALSGGLDSCVLLHLARFAAVEPGREWIAAHFDHAMRPGSRDDSLWVAGLCRAWGVPLHVARAAKAPGSEDEARRARYDFLEAVRSRVGAGLVLTAHHADDQAETVLFRLLRGTGSKGLGGIPARRGHAILRPLLDVWRAELLEYAGSVKLSWREDPTNRSQEYARNALRHRILPDVERLVAPGARQALVRLADLSRHEEEAWESVLPRLMEPLDLREVGAGLSLDREALAALHPGVCARVLRALAGRIGVSLDLALTRMAVDFASSGASGRAIDLGGDLTLGVELDRVVLGRALPAVEDRPLTIGDAGPGSGAVVLAGETVPVAWGGDEAVQRRRTERFDPEALRFPLIVRSRRPGDRMRLPGGTKKVKKILLESRIPPSERHRVPLVVDAEGEVLWIPGMARAEWTRREEAPDGLLIGIG